MPRPSPVPLLLRLSARVAMLGRTTAVLHERWLSCSPEDETESDTRFDAYTNARDEEVRALRAFHAAWRASEKGGERSLEARLLASIDAARESRGDRH